MANSINNKEPLYDDLGVSHNYPFTGQARKKIIPEYLKGDLIKGIITPDEEGIIYVGSDLANTLSGEEIHPNGFMGTAFANDPVESYYMGLPKNIQAVFNLDEIRRWHEYGGMPLSDIDEYLRGHELTHSRYLAPGNVGIGNKGYMIPKSKKLNEFNSRSGIEKWLSEYYSPDERPQERMAHLEGMKRLYGKYGKKINTFTPEEVSYSTGNDTRINNYIPTSLSKKNEYQDIVSAPTAFDRTLAFEGKPKQNDMGLYPFKQTSDKKHTSIYGLTLEDPTVRSMITAQERVFGLSEPRAREIAQARYNVAEEELKPVIPNFDKLPEGVRETLKDLHYNIGLPSLLGFHNMITDINSGDYASAAEELKYKDGKTKDKLSDYFNQTGRRGVWNYRTLADMGKLEKKEGLGKKILQNLSELNPFKTEEASAMELPYIPNVPLMKGGLVDDIGLYSNISPGSDIWQDYGNNDLPLMGDPIQDRPSDVVSPGSDIYEDYGGEDNITTERDVIEEITLPNGERIRRVVSAEEIRRREREKREREEMEKKYKEWYDSLPPEEKNKIDQERKDSILKDIDTTRFTSNKQQEQPTPDPTKMTEDEYVKALIPKSGGKETTGITLFDEFVSDSELRGVKEKKGEFDGQYIIDYGNRKYLLHRVTSESGKFGNEWDIFDITDKEFSYNDYPIDRYGSKDSAKAWIVQQYKSQLISEWEKAQSLTKQEKDAKLFNEEENLNELREHIQKHEKKDFGTLSREALRNKVEETKRNRKAQIPDQTIVTTQDALNWMKQQGIDTTSLEKKLSAKDRQEPATIIKNIINSEGFKDLNIFDKARVLSQAQRPIREEEYKESMRIPAEGSLKTKEYPSGIDDEGNPVKYIKGRPIKAIDTIKGCTNNCVECYALKGAAKCHKNMSIPVKVTIKGKLEKGFILRIGEAGDPASDWEHSNNEILKTYERSNKGITESKQVTPYESMFAITKLQKLSGYDPDIFNKLEVSVDPFFPADMIHTLSGVKALQDTYGDKVKIVLRIRSFKSKNQDLEASRDVATDFAKENKLKVLETKMRFVNKDIFNALELDESYYKYEKPQMKLKKPILADKLNKGEHFVCDEGETGKCQSCRNCEKLMFGEK